MDCVVYSISVNSRVNERDMFILLILEMRYFSIQFDDTANKIFEKPSGPVLKISVKISLDFETDILLES